MKTLLLLLKPAIQLALIILPGLFFMTLGILWFWRRQSNQPPLR